MDVTETRWLLPLRAGGLSAADVRHRRSAVGRAVALLGGLLTGVVSFGADGPASASGLANTRPLRWAVVSSANRGFDSLDSLSCLSAIDCFAAGSRRTARGFRKTLVERWNGHRFSIVPSPNPGQFNNTFDGISCVSAADCVAVGSADNKSDFTKTLVESWNGITWTVVASANPGRPTSIDILNDVSCASAAFCIAVGSYGRGDLNNSLVESWNGSRWSVMPSPSRGPHSDSMLASIDCLSVHHCVGVGSYRTPAGRRRTFAARWNGTTWTVQPTPNKGPVHNVNDVNSLNGVVCMSANTCRAVGTWSTAQGVTRTLIESWNGTMWAVVPSPNRGSASTPNVLNGVACVSPGDCTATGASAGGPGRATRTLIESWNGTRWSIVTSPNQGLASDFDSLSGIACTSATFCVTVGVYQNVNAMGHTLAETGTPA